MGEYGRQRRNMVWVLIVISLVLGNTVLPSDNMAHMGGAVAGFILGYALAPRYRIDHTNSSRHFIDRASLLRRWWVSVLGVAILIGGVWLSFNYWSIPERAGTSIPTPTVESIRYGQTVEGDLNTSQVDLWAFEGEANQMVTISMTSDSMDAYLELYDSDVSFLTNDDDGGGNRNARIDAFRLPETGTYIIVAQSADERLGPYELTLMLGQ